MLKFILNRPIAVSMIYLAFLVLGIVSLKQIPVSLMPDIAIPEITVQLSEPDMSARELENSLVKTLRQQLMQVAHLDDINSETQDGFSTIKLTFHYGADIDLAFIEVNEKVDRSMNFFPRNISRPKIIKASAGDIPVFYLNLTLNNSPQSINARTKGKVILNNRDSIASFGMTPIQASRLSNKPINQQSENSLYPVSQEFVELSNFSNNIIRKRLEQLSEVAMVDASGLVQSELLILFDKHKLNALGLTPEQLKQTISANNMKLGNLSINDGQYRYNIRFDAEIRNKEDLENIYLKVNSRLIQLKDIGQVIEHPQKLKGRVLSNGQEALTMAIIKQADAQMNKLKVELQTLVKQMGADYPEINFEVSRDQTQLLDYSIKNLQQTLWIGGLLAFVIMFVFLKGWKSPILIGITIPVSLIVSLLFFHLVGLSLNIISLSGLILGVGMMIDNSIIVIDNITQHINRSYKLQVISYKLTSSNKNIIARTGDEAIQTHKERIAKACINGTNEVFRPMLSSVLTTCAVFIPLIFIDGIAGSLFYDQAIAICIGLLSSLVVSVTLLPVYFSLFHKKENVDRQMKKSKLKKKKYAYELFYQRGFNLVMRNQPFAWLLVLVVFVASVFLYKSLPISQLPQMQELEKVVEIDWNESLSIEENKKRVKELIYIVHEEIESSTALIGEQQFLLDRKNAYSQTKAFLYLKAENEKQIQKCVVLIKKELNANFREAQLLAHSADNIFNVFFNTEQAPIEVRLRASSEYGSAYLTYLKNGLSTVAEVLNSEVAPIGLNEKVVLTADLNKLILYDVEYDQIIATLKRKFSADKIFQITNNTQFLPVVIGNASTDIDEIIQQTYLKNRLGVEIPLRELILKNKGADLKQILAGKEGEYYPIKVSDIPEDLEGSITNLKQAVKHKGFFEASVRGSYFDNKQLIVQLILILSISIVLLFFILAAQFESVLLPFIVLLEIPIDFFGALLFLKLFGAGINLMSLIGVIVMSGIIINDSILKIDTINHLRKDGFALLKALVIAGHRRLKPIVMTSLTTILALLPFLFMSGLGADLQRPLALAVIGGMLVGTLVSLYLIPLCYYYLAKLKLIK